MPTMILVKLILAHLIGDFIIQSEKWIADKEAKRWASPFLYIHSLIHFLLILLILWDIKYWPVALIIAVSHFFIDGLKLSFQTEKSRSFWFGADQTAHLMVIIAIWSIFWNEIYLYPPSNEFWVVLTALLFLSYPASYIVMYSMGRWTSVLTHENEGSLEGAGKYIGILERIFVYIAIIAGHLQIIGFLLAAKSVFRYGDLTRSKDRKLTEYILIGTLLSFLIAMITGFISVQFLK